MQTVLMVSNIIDIYCNGKSHDHVENFILIIRFEIIEIIIMIMKVRRQLLTCASKLAEDVGRVITPLPRCCQQMVESS